MFWLVLAGYLIFWQPGFFMNDEFGQGVGLDRLAGGAYAIDGDEVSPGYRLLEAHVYTHFGIPPPGVERAPVGSDLVNVMALPFHVLLGGLGGLLGLLSAAGMVASGALGMALRSIGQPSRVAVTVAAIAWTTSWARDVPLDPFQEAAAIQWLHATIMALGAALLFQLVQARSDTRTAGWTAALFAFGTPMFFWALNVKYHGLALALGTCAIWAYHAGPATRPLRTGLAFGLIGLVLSTHLPTGLMLLASAGLYALPAIGRPGAAARVLAGGAGLMVGLIPEMLFRVVRAKAALRERYLRVEPGDGVDAFVGEASRQSDAGYLQWAIWNDPGASVEAFLRNLFWTDWMIPDTSSALPFVALLPALAALPWLWRRSAVPETGRWLLLHAGVMFVLLGPGVYRNGAGFDLRHAAMLWPFLAIQMTGVWALLEGSRDRLRQWVTAVPVLFGAVVLTPLFLWRQWTGSYVFQLGTEFELTEPIRYLGVLLAVVVAFAMWRARPAWRARVLAVALTWGFMVQIVLQLGPARSHSPYAAGPFVFWPMQVLSEFVDFWTMGY